MNRLPSRSINNISENTRRLLSGVKQQLALSQRTFKGKVYQASSQKRLQFDMAIKTGRFAAAGRGVYKESVEGPEIDKIWVKKEFTNEDGSTETWLVAYTSDEDSIVAKVANKKLSIIKEAGTWSAPNTVEKASQLINYLDSIKGEVIDKKDVKDDLYGLIGNDSLFDKLEKKNTFSSSEVKEIVKVQIIEWLTNFEQKDWKDEWDGEAIKLLTDYFGIEKTVFIKKAWNLKKDFGKGDEIKYVGNIELAVKRMLQKVEENVSGLLLEDLEARGEDLDNYLLKIREDIVNTLINNIGVVDRVTKQFIYATYKSGLDSEKYDYSEYGIRGTDEEFKVVNSIGKTASIKKASDEELDEFCPQCGNPMRGESDETFICENCDTSYRAENLYSAVMSKEWMAKAVNKAWQYYDTTKVVPDEEDIIDYILDLAKGEGEDAGVDLGEVTRVYQNYMSSRGSEKKLGASGDPVPTDTYGNFLYVNDKVEDRDRGFRGEVVQVVDTEVVYVKWHEGREGDVALPAGDKVDSNTLIKIGGIKKSSSWHIIPESLEPPVVGDMVVDDYGVEGILDSIEGRGVGVVNVNGELWRKNFNKLRKKASVKTAYRNKRHAVDYMKRNWNMVYDDLVEACSQRYRLPRGECRKLYSELLEEMGEGGEIDKASNISWVVKTAANPSPKDIPIAQGIKSKNITIDETGGMGSAKVTIEFTDVKQGWDFYQNSVKGKEPTQESEMVGPKQPEQPPNQATPGQAPMMGQSSLKIDITPEFNLSPKSFPIDGIPLLYREATKEWKDNSTIKKLESAINALVYFFKEGKLKDFSLHYDKLNPVVAGRVLEFLTSALQMDFVAGIQPTIKTGSRGRERISDYYIQDSLLGEIYSIINDNGVQEFTKISSPHKSMLQPDGGLLRVGQNLGKFSKNRYKHEDSEDYITSEDDETLASLLVKKASEIGTPEWVKNVINTASSEDWENAKRIKYEYRGPAGKEKVAYLSDLLLDAARAEGDFTANSVDAMRWLDGYFAVELGNTDEKLAKIVANKKLKEQEEAGNQKRSWVETVEEYDVTARAYKRVRRGDNDTLGEPIGKARVERVNVKTEDLFNGNFGDWPPAEDEESVKEAYEAFWNKLNDNSAEIVKVEKVEPVVKKRHKVKASEDFQRGVILNVYNSEGMYLGVTSPMYGDIVHNVDEEELLDLPEVQTILAEKGAEGGSVEREEVYQIDGRDLERVYYEPSDSMELYDRETDTWYNLSGQQLRDPKEYDTSSEGYTPFGDEGDNWDDEIYGKLVNKYIESKSPPGREKQVEKLKEEGFEDDEAFAISWAQYNKSKEASKLKFSYEYKPGEEIGYHGRVGRIVQKEGSGYIVYFEDIAEETWIDREELLEQEGLSDIDEDEDMISSLKKKTYKEFRSILLHETLPGNRDLMLELENTEYKITLDNNLMWSGFDRVEALGEYEKAREKGMEEKAKSVLLHETLANDRDLILELENTEYKVTINNSPVWKGYSKIEALDYFERVKEEQFKTEAAFRFKRASDITNTKMLLLDKIPALKMLLRYRDFLNALQPFTNWEFYNMSYAASDLKGVEYLTEEQGNQLLEELHNYVAVKATPDELAEVYSILKPFIEQLDAVVKSNLIKRGMDIPNDEIDINTKKMPEEKELDEIKDSIWYEISVTNNRWSGIEKALRTGEYNDEWPGIDFNDWVIKDIKSYIDYRVEMTNMMSNSSLKFGADISDEVQPLSWTTESPEEERQLGNQDPNPPQLQQPQPQPPVQDNVIYNSTEDVGPEIQTTVNPKEKEVTIKFMDSPQQQALKDAIDQPQQPPGQLPQEEHQMKGLPQAPQLPGTEEEFGDSEIPVEF